MDKPPEETRLNPGQKIGAVRELSFAEGLNETLRRIREILKTKDFAIVAFTAFESNVGKTTLAKAVLDELGREEVLVFIRHSFRDLSPSDLKFIENSLDSSSMNERKVVFVFDQVNWMAFTSAAENTRIREHCGNEAKEVFNNTRWQTDKVDLFVGISSEMTPFPKNILPAIGPIADIIIKNEGASIKKSP